MGTSYNPKIVTDGLVLNLDPANVKSYPANQDPFVNNVSLMLSMDGANGSTTFTDLSQNALAVTAAGNAQISTTQSQFGGASAYFDGTGDYLSLSSNSIFAIGTGDFTVEFWMYITSRKTYGYILYTQGGSDALFVSFDAAGNYLRLTNAGTVYAVSPTLNLNQWYHIAVVRSSGSSKVYVDGVGGTAVACSTSFVQSGPLIGGTASANYFQGYIDDLRITKGISRYNANFTPPTAPLSLPGRLTDLTKNKYLTTLTSGPTFTSSNGGAINLSGTLAQYLTVNGGMPSGISTGFTFECWVRVTDLASRRAIIQADDNIDTGLEIVVETTGAVKCSEYAYKDGAYQICITASGAVAAGAWTHITVSRTTGNLYTIYINGVSKATGTRAFIIQPTTRIGYIDPDSTPLALSFKGGMSIIRNYNRTLTSTEVFQNYNATKGRFV